MSTPSSNKQSTLFKWVISSLLSIGAILVILGNSGEFFGDTTELELNDQQAISFSQNTELTPQESLPTEEILENTSGALPSTGSQDIPNSGEITGSLESATGDLVTGTILSGDEVDDSYLTGNSTGESNSSTGSFSGESEFHNSPESGSGNLGSSQGMSGPTLEEHDLEQAITTGQSTGIISIQTGQFEHSYFTVYSPRDLVKFVLSGLLIPSFDPDSKLTNSALFATNIIYSSFDDTIKILIPNETIISTFDKVPFDTSRLQLNDEIKDEIKDEAKESDYDSSIIIQKYDPESDSYIEEKVLEPDDNKVLFDFGIPDQHLIFTKALKVTVLSDQADGTLVDLSADHGFGRTKEGIAISSNTQCSGGIASLPETITKVQSGKVEFYICGASTFSVTYTGGANMANFADLSISPGYKDKTVTFITGVHFDTGSIINDIDVIIRRRPIDSQNPASFGNTACYPGEKYFRVTHPDGTHRMMITGNTLTTPANNCPETTTTFDQSAATQITNNYTSGTYRPNQSLTGFVGKSPFGTWTLRMGDRGNQDGVILYSYTIIIKVIDPPICIYSPTSVFTGIVVKNTSQLIDQQLDYFQVDDQRGLNSGYYTTLQISNLSQSGGNGIIPNTSIFRKADPLVLLSGIANTGVQLGAARSSYTTGNTTATFIFRNTGPNSFKKSRYGSKLWLRINVPPYANVGTYSGAITYTLYEY